MIKKLTAVVSTIFSISGLVMVVYALINKPNNELLEKEEFIVLISLSAFSLSTLLYLGLTNFGKVKETSELQNLDNENQLLKKKIEQEELKSRLETVQKGDA